MPACNEARAPQNGDTSGNNGYIVAVVDKALEEIQLRENGLQGGQDSFGAGI